MAVTVLEDGIAGVGRQLLKVNIALIFDGIKRAYLNFDAAGLLSWSLDDEQTE